jgi:hypothetical protein
VYLNRHIDSKETINFVDLLLILGSICNSVIGDFRNKCDHCSVWQPRQAKFRSAMPSCIILAPLAGLYALATAVCGVEATVIMCAVLGGFAVATGAFTMRVPPRPLERVGDAVRAATAAGLTALPAHGSSLQPRS